MDIKEIFSNTLCESENFYKMGQGIKFDQSEVVKYNQNVEIGFDHGVIVKNVGSDYIVKLDNGNEIKVKNQNALSVGNADADPT